MEQINQKLEQYLWFFVDHRQKNWLEWLASAEFAVNNKVHIAMKVLPFIANYRRELRIGEVGVALKKMQKDMKKQADRGRKEIKDWKKGNKVMLSTKDLVFKERPVRKLAN